MEKRIITVSREFGSGGRSVGKALAKRLGWKYYDKELVKAGLISEDTDLMEGLTYKQFRDEIADERLKEYRHQSDYARYLEKERSLS